MSFPLSVPLIQVGVLVVLTNVVRAVGDRLGPRWGAMALGMPSTTAVMLVGGGWERGPAEGARAAGVGLLGLVGAVVVPLAYAATALRGRGVVASATSAVAGYVLAAGMLGLAPDLGAWGGIGVAGLGVSAGCLLARRLPESSGEPATRGRSGRSMAVRAAVPAAFVMALRGLGAAAGPDWAGLFATFPAMSLAVLATLHLEGGVSSACGFARSMPRGNLGTAAFLAAFRLLCRDFGPVAAAGLGYAAALVAMAGLVRSSRRAAVPRMKDDPGPVVILPLPRPPRMPRRFAPGLERIAA